MNGYDFDKTIYCKDSSVEFYIYLVKRYYKYFHLLSFGFTYLLYKIKCKTKLQAKEKMFSIVTSIPNIDEVVKDFWNTRKLEDWYSRQQQDDDVVISASPYFLLKPICEKSGISYLIASNVDKNTGKFCGENCFGEVKCKRYLEMFPNQKMNTFFSDSMTDSVMLKVAAKFCLIKQKNHKKETILFTCKEEIDVYEKKR